ncbi:MAG: gluconokinase [Acidobacteriota bacterium]
MSIVSPPDAKHPLILALDLGTSSARAVVYDVEGRLVEGIEGRVGYQMDVTQDGGVEIDADELVDILGRVLDEALAEASGLIPHFESALTGVACCTFWHSLIGVGADGRAVTPLYNWSDTRSANDAAALAADPGRAWLHSRTGALPHASYYPAKIRWLRRTRPHLIVRVARWVSIGEYFYERLFGRALCSLSMASGTGLLNPNTRGWDSEVLAELEIGPERLSELAEAGETLSGLRREFAERWPMLKDVPWVPAIGDGAASNIGSGCTSTERVAINVGTSGAMRICWEADSVRIPDGLWCYLADHRHFVMGGALSNAGDVFAWCRRTLQLEPDKIDAELGSMQPDSHGLTVLPFFSGERSTGWADYARASIVGMSLGTRPLDILRASLEAVAYRFAAIYALLRSELPTNTRLIASGGGILGSKVWTQMMADVIGVPVIASTAPEASSRGAALLALQALGWIKDFADVPAPLGTAFESRPNFHEAFQRAQKRQRRLYDILIKPGPGVLTV